MSAAQAQPRAAVRDIPSERGGAQTASPPAQLKTLQERLRLPLMLIAPLVVIGVALYFYLTGGRYQTTDDAYVEAAQMVISSNIAGRVSEIDVRDNELVKKGAVLFRIDDAPFRIAAQEAQARLASARLEIEALQASYRQRQAVLTGAEDTLAYQKKRIRPAELSARLRYFLAGAGEPAAPRARQRAAGAQLRA